MNANSEVIALKASGLSAHQVLAPLVLASLGVSMVTFVFNERVVTRSTATLSSWQKVNYGPVPLDRGDRTNVWVATGPNLLEVAQVHGRGKAAQLRDVTVYLRNRDGALIGLIRAANGKREGDGWRIWPAKRFYVASGRVTDLGSGIVARGVQPEQLTLADVDADSLPFDMLATAIADLHAAGRPVKALEGALWHKLSGPLSSVLMPLLGAVAGFGIARSGQLFARAVTGMALGFAYFVADNFALAMGDLGAYPPFLAAWAPFILFLLIGEAVLLRTEE
jgi:lipopolysaccharide export system permease protein